ncbi:hypothetical protein [Virgibacillus sp. SK37]|uniref:hypothetical protein n=1 Tax=Virgibacillus sp. SK37 TaxID=403957 RepID=UPI0004D1D1E5|nr:hypothetical protein [Virgibacillus sp. SK37]AIF45375.1 hypothetical protein X953_08640 [Virgibacillus sp. SK37]
MWKEWTKTHTYIALGIVAAVIMIYIISFFALIKPAQEEVQTEAQKVSMYEKQLQKADSQANNNSELTEEERSLHLLVPPAKSPDDVLRKLQQAATAAKVTIEYVGTEGQEQLENKDGNEQTNGLPQERYVVDVYAEKLNDIHYFLDEIQKSERLITIDTLSIQQTAEQVTASLQIKTYAQR